MVPVPASQSFKAPFYTSGVKVPFPHAFSVWEVSFVRFRRFTRQFHICRSLPPSGQPGWHPGPC